MALRFAGWVTQYHLKMTVEGVAVTTHMQSRGPALANSREAFHTQVNLQCKEAQGTQQAEKQGGVQLNCGLHQSRRIWEWE